MFLSNKDNSTFTPYCSSFLIECVEFLFPEKLELMKEPNNHEKDQDEKTDDESEDKITDEKKMIDSDTSGISHWICPLKMPSKNVLNQWLCPLKQIS